MIWQFKKKSFWLTGAVLFVGVFILFACIFWAMFNSQNRDISLVVSNLEESGFSDVANAFDDCNLGRNEYENTNIHTLSGCKETVLEIRNSKYHRRQIEDIFTTHNL